MSIAPVETFSIATAAASAGPEPETQTAQEADLLARVRRGDQSAATELVRELYPMVHRLVRYHRPRQIPPEDLAQEVFMKMFARLEQYRGTVPLSHWVSRIALSTCLDHLRFRKRRPELSRADLTEGELAVYESVQGSDQADAPDILAARDLVLKLLERLPPKDRLIIQLFDLQQLTAEEIRQHTGMKTSLVKVRVYRARRRLRQLFIELEAGEGRLPESAPAPAADLAFAGAGR